MFSDPLTNIEQFQIDPGITVADLGSGTGFYSFALSDMTGPSGTVYAVDVQKDLIDKLKTEADNRNVTNIKTIWGDLDEIGGTRLKDNSITRAVVANTFFQLENKENFLQELKRILIPKSGKALLIDWTDSFSGMGPNAESVIKPDVARVMFEEAGFVFDREINAGDHHYGIIFKML